MCLLNHSSIVNLQSLAAPDAGLSRPFRLEKSLMEV